LLLAILGWAPATSASAKEPSDRTSGDQATPVNVLLPRIVLRTSRFAVFLLDGPVSLVTSIGCCAAPAAGGTGGEALESGLFLSAAADAGHHVIGLQYNTTPPGTGFCETNPDPDCFANFREKRSWGDDASPEIADLPQEAIVTRLTRLLQKLAKTNQPRAGTST